MLPHFTSSAMPVDGARRRCAATAFWTAFFSFLAALLVTRLHGYRFGDSNHSFHVPLLKSLIDARLYPDDVQLMARDGHATFVYPALGHVLPATEWVEPAFFVLYLIAHTVIFAAGAAIARRLFPGSPVPLVMVFVMMARLPSLGAERGLISRFAHTDLAFGILLWALYFALAERRRAAFGLAGFAFNLQGLYALHLGAMLGLDALAERRRLGVRRMGQLAAIFLLAAAPALIWALRLVEPLTEEWLGLVSLRSAHHSLPLSFPVQSYGRYLAVLGLGALSLRDRPQGSAHRRVARLTVALAALLGVGVIFSELLPLKVVIQAQLFRSTRFLTFFVMLYLSHFFVRTWQRGGVGRLAVILCALALELPRFEWLLLPAMALFLLLEPWGRGGPRVVAALAGFAGALAWGGYGVRLPLVTAQTMSYVELVADPHVMGWVIVCVGACAVLGRGGRAQLAVALAALSFLAVWSLPAFYQQRRESYRASRLVRLQEWMRTHTTREAVFLTPPYVSGLRVFSERSVVGEWKDGTLLYFSSGFGREWHERMTALGLEQTFDDLRPAELRHLGARYGATYLVFRTDRPLPFRKVHRQGSWSVYRLPEPGTSGAGAAGERCTRATPSSTSPPPSHDESGTRSPSTSRAAATATSGSRCRKAATFEVSSRASPPYQNK